jgi:predicted ATP-binding protein involved in virulence
MRIEACSLNQIRGLPPITLDFTDPLSGQARARTVIAGSNGSGKTTILESIGQLLALANFQKLDWVSLEQASAQLIVADLPPSVTTKLRVEVKAETGNAGIFPVESALASPLNQSNLDKIQGRGVEIFGSARHIPAQIQRAEKEDSHYPNCLYFPSENRQLQKKKAGQIIAEPTSYRWIYRFSDSQQWPGSLESFLVAMYFRDLIALNDDYQHPNGKNGKVHSPGEFKQFTAIINRFLANKQIVGVDRQTFRLQVQTAHGQSYGIDQLSSGEKQIILLLGELQRRIQPSSIVLIDEPELHLHPKWQRQLVRALTDLCTTYDAQLIMTTHSEEIANAVYEHELILLDDIFAPNYQPTTVPSKLPL